MASDRDGHLTPDDKNEIIRSRYIEVMSPLFFPEDPVRHDIVRYFGSLLRVDGMEDRGWDPHLESRALIDDFYTIMQWDGTKVGLSELAHWRLGLVFYAHIVEMDAPYEVLTNLLRFRLGHGYSPNPFYDYLSEKQRKRFKSSGLYPVQKIEIIKQLSKEANLQLGEVFDEFYRADLRNAINHADFVFTNEEFRSRKGGREGPFRISLEELDDILTKAKVFIGTFFGLDVEARRVWGMQAGTAKPYDERYKGLLEILADGDKLMCGFRVHWPNHSVSTYRRREEGIEMTNCSLDLRNKNISFFVGQYARQPGPFSPLVERGEDPRYTRVDGSEADLLWPDNA